MFLTFSYMMLIMTTFLFSLMKHPLSMGLMLFIQTLAICLITGMTYESFWFSYILSLVFLGGMLVLFIYIISLASNEMFNFSMKLLLFILMMMIMFFSLSLFIDNTQFCLIFNYETLLNYKFHSMDKESHMMMFKLFNLPTNFMTLFMINYLFFTLIVIVKITNFFGGPLRNLT